MNIKSPCIIDISHWEVPDWPNVDKSLVLGVIMKATQGKAYIDPTCATSYAGALGIPRGLYHFFEPNDISLQVENFILQCEAIGALVNGVWLAEIPPVLDVEYHPPQNGVVGTQLAMQVKVWLDMVEERTGVKPIIYTSDSYWNFLCTPIYWTSYTVNGVVKWDWIATANATAPAWTNDYLLWTAQYPFNPDTQNEPARLPRGWADWFLWQYSDQGQMQGIFGRVDVNVFNGNEAEWLAFVGAPIIPPGEIEMNKVTTLIKLNVRPAPSVNNTALRTLAAGTVIETKYDETTDAAGNRWIRITETPAEYISTYQKNYVPPLLATVEKIVVIPPTGLPIITVNLTAPGYPPFSGTWTPL